MKAQVKERLEIFSPGGAYIFDPVHNIMADTSIENILAMFEAVHAYDDIR